MKDINVLFILSRHQTIRLIYVQHELSQKKKEKKKLVFD